MSQNKQLSNDPGEDFSELEAISYVWETINNWKKKSETWALLYSSYTLGAINSGCGMVINNYYRKKLNLGKYGYIASALPIIFIPGTMTLAMHKHVISTDMIINPALCPVCSEIKSAAIQLGFGIVYPMILAPISAFMLANRYSTYRLPSVVEKPKELLQIGLKLTKPLKNTLLYLAIGQLVFSSIFTYFELQNTVSIRKTLEKNDFA